MNGSSPAVPTCPSCGSVIEWKHSFSFWNPWTFPCPHCKAPLEASRIQKVIAVAVVPIGWLLAAIPIFLEERGIWRTGHTLVFLAVIVLILVVAARTSWRHTRFTIKVK